MRTIVYPYRTPIILDDETFIIYGGETGTSTSAQRTAAYLAAEKRATRFIGTFLLPTTVTGTHVYNPVRNVATEFGYVHSINSVIIRSRDLDEDCSITETSKCAYIRDDRYGILDINYALTCCACTPVNVYQVQVSYTAGLPTGTITSPDYLTRLVALADIELKEISGDGGNEAPGDIGVQSFSSEGYSEKRVKLRTTTLGSSPRANWCAEGLRDLRRVKGIYL